MPEAAAGAVLSTRALGKRFGGLAAVTDVSIDVATGEIHALIGPNGAGKSTLINLLSGDLSPTTGGVFLDGQPATGLSPDRRGRAGIGRSYQQTTVFPSFTVAENVKLAAQAHLPGGLTLIWRAALSSAMNGRAGAALALVGMTDRARARAGSLSHGEQRQLEIAMVLATDPKVVLLDEPLAGMGAVEARAMIALIAMLKRGRAVLLVEHDMDAVFELADRLTVMADGRIIASGSPADVRRHRAVRTAYLGEDDPG